MARIIATLLEEAVLDGAITCPNCGNRLEVDAEECHCGWKNPLTTYGLI